MNIVEEYLFNNKNLKLSVRNIAKRTGLRTKQVTYICNNSKILRKVNPIEVGSLKYIMNTFTAI
jgi:hypothetical protein